MPTVIFEVRKIISGTKTTLLLRNAKDVYITLVDQWISPFK